VAAAVAGIVARVALEEAEDAAEESWNDAVFKAIDAELWCFVGRHVARAFFRTVSVTGSKVTESSKVVSSGKNTSRAKVHLQLRASPPKSFKDK